jgi:ABC-type phosphate transport system, permease component
MRSRDIKEKAVRVTLTTMAGSSLLALAGIVIFLFMEGLPLFSEYPFLNFLFGHLWYPTEEPGLFGIFPLLVASLAVTVFRPCWRCPWGC